MDECANSSSHFGFIYVRKWCEWPETKVCFFLYRHNCIIRFVNRLTEITVNFNSLFWKLNLSKFTFLSYIALQPGKAASTPFLAIKLYKQCEKVVQDVGSPIWQPPASQGDCLHSMMLSTNWGWINLYQAHYLWLSRESVISKYIKGLSWLYIGSLINFSNRHIIHTEGRMLDFTTPKFTSCQGRQKLLGCSCSSVCKWSYSGASNVVITFSW